jgi:hypothetical protein
MVIKYTIPRPSKICPKWDFCMKLNHLATLGATWIRRPTRKTSMASEVVVRRFEVSRVNCK